MSNNQRSGTPKRLLVATDLTPACDRALDRGLQLARAWGAELHVLHVIPRTGDISPREWLLDAPWVARADPAEAVKKAILRDLGQSSRDPAVTIHVAVGSAGEAIMDIVAEHGCDLIITGTSRNISLRRLVLGSTAEQLIRKARVPVLVVRERVHGAYPAIIAATDFSVAAAEPFETAVHLFPQVPVVLFHGYHIPFSGILINDQIRQEFQQLGEKAAREFLKRVGLPADFPRIVRHGDPDELLADHLDENGPALVVVGTHGSSGFFDEALGSMAQRIITRVLSDVLVVPYSKRT